MISPSADAPRRAKDALTERFYRELHTLAQRAFASERGGHTLQPTALVHEVCVRVLTSSPLPDVPRAERLALAARVLRQVLIDHHRARGADKRGGSALRVELDPEVAESHDGTTDFAAVHTALERLRALDERQAEVVTLRIFGGLTMEQVAAALGVSKRTVEGDWKVACAWLRRALAAEEA